MKALTPAERAAALAALELPPQATREQITQAYRRLARTAHPDATGRTDAEAGDRFAVISEAYHRLTASLDEPSAPPVSRGSRVPRGRAAPVPQPPIVAGPVMFTPWSSREPRGGTRHG
jgi:hypothetical protein